MPDEEREQYVQEHVDTFGHRPVPGLGGGSLCIHPYHDTLRRLINGADIEIPFDPSEVVAADDPRVTEYERRYDDLVDEYRDMIAEVEEREAFDARKGS